MFIKEAPNSHGFVSPRDVEQLWRDQFDWVYREYDFACFPMTIHPDVSGPRERAGVDAQTLATAFLGRIERLNPGLALLGAVILLFMTDSRQRVRANER